MRLLKSHVLLRLVNSYVIDSPEPANISYLWNFGSLLGVCLILQILTGAFLAMHYQPNVDLAFNSVEHIMRDVNNGWILRYTHANVASFFFIFVYIHVGRGLYYGSYKSPRTLVWSIGVIILILMMATAFLGYDISLKWCELYILPHDLYVCVSLPTISSPNLANIYLKKFNIKPIAVFENLQLAKSRNQAKDCLKDLAGIYLIVNLVDGSSYVGSATSNRLYTRLMIHLYYLKGNSRITNAVKLLGRENFAFVVIYLFPEKIIDKTNLILLSLEQYFIDLINPNYNILPLAGNSFGYKHTPETILKMRNNYSDLRQKKIGNLNKGKSLSEKTRELIREAALNLPTVSQEFIEKCKTRGGAIIVTRLSDGSLVGNFKDIVSAAKQLKCGEKTIRRALKAKGIVKSTYKIIDSV